MRTTNTRQQWPRAAPLARILFIGDVVGPLGLATVEALLPALRRDHDLDFVIANGENSVDNGAGISPSTAERLLDAGVDVITTGNHAHDAPDAAELYSSCAPVIRPDNLANSSVGNPSVIVERYGLKLGVANVIGSNEGATPNVLVQDANAALRPLQGTADVIVLDIHASWPAEKLALATTLDGQICAAVGTHTHVPTADARLLDRRTAYVSDVGMTGARQSVIGFHPPDMIRQIQEAAAPLPAPATSGNGVLMAVLITASVDGLALAIDPFTADTPLDDAFLTTQQSNGNIPAPRPPINDTPAAVIFDCDGLLIDSAACRKRAYETVLAAQGRSLAPRLMMRLNGASVAGAASVLGVSPEVLRAELCSAFLAGPLIALPGAPDLVEHLHDRLPIAIATNAPADLIALALRTAGINTQLPIISAEGMAGKPAPDVYLAACKQLNVEPRRAVALEDSPTGATAAKAAGLSLIYVPSGEPADVTPDLTVARLDDPHVLQLLNLRPSFARCARREPQPHNMSARFEDE